MTRKKKAAALPKTVTPASPAQPASSGRRKLRARTTPTWLVERPDLDGVAQRRTLAVLSVLSGERPVTEVIAELDISRGTYYQWEERALKAVLCALTPGGEEAPAAGQTARIAELETQLQKLGRDKRRAEQLLLLTRKVLKAGPVTSTAGRPRKTKRAASSTRSGSIGSSVAATKASSATPTMTPDSSAASTPRPSPSAR